MPKIKLPDLSNVEDVGAFNDLPKGLYVFKIREASEGETGEQSKHPGQPMGIIVLDPVRVVGGAKIKSGEYQGLWHRFPLDDSNPGWTPRLKEFVNAVPKAVSRGTLDLNKAEGQLVIGKVRDGKNADEERTAELSSLMKYTEEAAGGAADDDDEEVGEDELWTEEDLNELSLEDLKDAADELEVETPAKLTSKNKKKVIAAILEAQEEDDEDEDEDEDEEGDDEAYAEEDLLEMSKDDLAEVAAEFEVEFPSRLTAPGRKRVVAAILEAQGGDEEDEDEDEDEDGDEEGYTEEDLNELSLTDLKEVAGEFEVPVPKGKPAIVKKKLIVAILEAQGEGEEDEDEDGDEEDDGYDEMSKTELAKECRSRGIKVKQGMSQSAMVEALRASDAEGDEDEDEDEDEELDPDSMSAAEVKAALTERGIKATGSLKVQRAKLTKALEADDDGDPF